MWEDSPLGACGEILQKEVRHSLSPMLRFSVNSEEIGILACPVFPLSQYFKTFFNKKALGVCHVFPSSCWRVSLAPVQFPISQLLCLFTSQLMGFHHPPLAPLAFFEEVFAFSKLLLLLCYAALIFTSVLGYLWCPLCLLIIPTWTLCYIAISFEYPYSK